MTSFDKIDGIYKREYITQSLYAFCDKINVLGLGIKKGELGGLITEILKDNPYLFFVNSSMGYEAEVGGNVLSIFPIYNMSASEYAAAKELCEKEISRAMTLINGVEEEYLRALILHDYLCINYSYDETLTSDSMYSFLRTSSGTCQGYTYAYTALLRAAKIEVSFAASDSMAHIWNVVKIDGAWYHVDVTWDDRENFSFVYNSFLKSDEGITEANHKDWYTSIDLVCDSYIYNEEIVSPLAKFTCTGDVNCDGEVDALDLILYGAGECSPSNHAFLLSAADIDGDLSVGEIDKALLLDKILN